MSLENLKQLLPDSAKDLRVNLDAIERAGALTLEQRWTVALASAFAARNTEVTREIRAAAAEYVDEASLGGARIAADLMAMNNVYYRFVHLASNEAYGKLPARLRMQAMKEPGIPELDFELASIAVSALNGCGLCIDSHERKLRAAGATSEAVQDAVRIAAIVYSIAASLDAERALAVVSDF